MTIPFSRSIQMEALRRQRNRCASCGSPITDIGQLGAPDHPFGEVVQGHHVIPHMMKGPNTVDNCVILCVACHVNAHAGGRFADVSMYNDIKNLPIQQKINRITRLYPHYNG